MIEACAPNAPAAARSSGAHRVIEVRELSASGYVLRFSRGGLDFRAGQWVSLGLPRSGDMREYTLYSSPHDPFLEVLIKEIPAGRVSRALRRCLPGDELKVEGPRGAFTMAGDVLASARFLFVATGTGVSPFRCFAREYPDLDYLLLHGVRDSAELYGREDFAAVRHIPCLSRALRSEADAAASRAGGRAFAGRVTDYLAEAPALADRYCYLCGNSDMIYEAYAILRDRGVPRSRIFAEVYF